jgi:hypothetical protein
VESLSQTTIDIIVRKRRLPRVVRLFAEELHLTLSARVTNQRAHTSP